MQIYINVSDDGRVTGISVGGTEAGVSTALRPPAPAISSAGFQDAGSPAVAVAASEADGQATGGVAGSVDAGPAPTL